VQSYVTNQSLSLTITPPPSELKNVGESALEPFLDKAYRDAYLDGCVKGSIAYQIQALREKSGLSQKEFGEKIHKPQSVVSRLENTEYGAVSINTLLGVAKENDVALEVRFTNYVTMLSTEISPSSFKVDNIFETYHACAVAAPRVIENTVGVVLLLVNPTIAITINGTGVSSVSADIGSGRSSWQKQLIHP
jgi:transcriptional regulator with XRE-family HTH domain